MTPDSIRRFNILFPIATLLVLVSAVLSFTGLEEQALAGVGSPQGGTGTMGVWMVMASIFIFLLLAAVLWTTISLLRMAFMRYVLALIVVYALFQNYQALTVQGPNAATLVDLVASLIAVWAVVLLFQPDARQWFAENPDHRDPA